MAQEPPPGYVAFVAEHLSSLRNEATEAVGDEHDGDALYPEALTDVARRWSWLELRRTWLGQAGAADEYLHRALLRRVRSRESERMWAPQEEEWYGEIEVWHPDAYRPSWSSTAVRLAPYLRSTVRVEVGPLAEASIAWWHAYESHRRRRLVAVLVAVLVLVAILMRVQAGAPQ